MIVDGERTVDMFRCGVGRSIFENVGKQLNNRRQSLVVCGWPLWTERADPGPKFQIYHKQVLPHAFGHYRLTTISLKKYVAN